MFEHDPKHRPDIQQCLKHPYLLSTDDQFKLVTYVGNELEIAKDDPSFVLQQLKVDPSLSQSSWIPKVDPDLMEYMWSFRDYTDQVAHLLRFIRNTLQHWNDRRFAPTVKEKLGQPKEYFLKIFPTLPVVVH